MTRWADDTVLDDPSALDEADPGGMLRATADSGAQIRRAVASIDEGALAAVRDAALAIIRGGAS